MSWLELNFQSLVACVSADVVCQSSVDSLLSTIFAVLAFHGSVYPPYLAVDLVAQNGHPGAVGVAPDGPDDTETFACLRTRERPSIAQRPNLP